MPHASPRPAHLLLTCAALVAVACTSPAVDAPAKEDEKAAPEPAEPALAIQPVSEDEARAVFEAWVAAQDKLDFDAYAKVYAEDFSGIKRNGHHTKHLERAEWLESRRKRFDQGFKITATGLKLEAAQDREPGSMLAHFTQRWATPSFADIGPKQLLIARRGEQAQIVHEEMISSHVTRRRGLGDAPLMVLELSGAHYAVLGTGQPEWVDDSAAPTLLDGSTVRKPLVRERVKKTKLEWIGREVSVREAKGSLCTAKVESLEVVGRVDPSAEIDDTLWEIWEEREPTDAELASAMWTAIVPDLFLLGKLDGCAGDLALPVEGVEDASVVDYQQAQKVDAALAEKIVAAFRALPDYKAEQNNYVEDLQEWAEGDEANNPGPWELIEGEEGIVLQLWSGGDERYALRSVSVGEGCGDWAGSLWALWRIGEGDALELVASGAESGDFMGAMALEPQRIIRWHDALWFLTSNELYKLDAKGNAKLVYATEPAFFGCPC